MISLIVAYDINKGIGKNNFLPWRDSKDMSLFVEKTKNSNIIMGRNTWESLPKKPLKNRCNIVVSTTMKSSDDCFISSSLEEACHKSGNNAIIIGGAQIYKKALELNLVKKMYISYFNKAHECDTFFPNFDIDQWEELSSDNYGNFLFYTLLKK
jgi:dihydrofolate reductase